MVHTMTSIADGAGVNVEVLIEINRVRLIYVTARSKLLAGTMLLIPTPAPAEMRKRKRTDQTKQQTIRLQQPKADSATDKCCAACNGKHVAHTCHRAKKPKRQRAGRVKQQGEERSGGGGGDGGGGGGGSGGQLGA